MTGLQDHELADAGYLPGLDPKGLFGPYDKLERWDFEQPRFDDIWEEKEGIYSKYAPHVLLSGEDRLSDCVTMWMLGVRELRLDDLERLSNFEIESIVTMSASHHRKLFPKKGNDGH